MGNMLMTTIGVSGRGLVLGKELSSRNAGCTKTSLETREVSIQSSSM